GELVAKLHRGLLAAIEVARPLLALWPRSPAGRSGCNLLAEGGLQRPGCFLNGLPALLKDRGHAEEAVNNARIAGAHDRDIGLPETRSVLLAIVAQWIVLGGDDQGWWQTAQVIGLLGGHIGVTPVGFAPQVMLEEP